MKRIHSIVSVIEIIYPVLYLEIYRNTGSLVQGFATLNIWGFPFSNAQVVHFQEFGLICHCSLAHFCTAATADRFRCCLLDSCCCCCQIPMLPVGVPPKHRFYTRCAMGRRLDALHPNFRLDSPPFHQSSPGMARLTQLVRDSIYLLAL